MPQTEAEKKTFTRPTFLMYFDIFSYKKNFLRTLKINIRAKNTEYASNWGWVRNVYTSDVYLCLEIFLY